MRHGIMLRPSIRTATRASSHVSTSLRLMALSVFALVLVALGSPIAQAQTYTDQPLHGFSGAGNGDGSVPKAGLIAVSGMLYGTTYQGGNNNDGSLFVINSDGTGYKTLYSFGTGSDDGISPYASLVALNGKLYGTTFAGGGTSNDGTIFVINSDGTGYKTLYSFTKTNGDGGSPYSGLLALNGILYGTTSSGGANGKGTIFSINSDGTGYQVIYSFGTVSGDGFYPYASLIAVNGILYGTTYEGGTNSSGSVFSINPDGTGYQVVYSLGGGGGVAPYSDLLSVNGKLYGTTSYGGTSGEGTVFAVNTDGSGYQTLYSFTSTNSDGGTPYTDLIAINGKLYGTTYGGGSSNDGTIFSINFDGSGHQIVYNFTKSNGDGGNPYAGVIRVGGKIYGTTYGGGSNGDGMIFSLTLFTAPIAKNDNGRGIANHTIIIAAPGVLGNDNNGGDISTAASVVTNPTHGTIAFNGDGSFNYTPSSGYVGPDSFTYKDTNLAGTSNTATCALTIGPVAYNDTGRTYFNTAITIGAPGVLANDATGGLATTAALVTNPAHGTITFNSNGGFTYTPTSGFLGADSFTYKISSSAGTSAPATCTITVQARTPVANNDAGKVLHNTTATFNAPGVLGNDNPGDTGTITTSLVTGPSHGTITFHTDGSFVYKPTTGFIGTDSFTYKDTNAVGTSNTATCTLTVQ